MKWPFFSHADSSQRMARYETRAVDLIGLRRHLPAMRTTADELAHSATHFQIEECKAFVLYSMQGLAALGDLHLAAMADLEQGRDFGAMVLAKESIRLAVDTIYVLCDPEADRLESLMRRHLDAQRERVSRWHHAFPDDAQPGPWLARLDARCRLSPFYARAAEWPTLTSRAASVGLDSWVHPILSKTSDAGEMATEQFIDALDSGRIPEPERSSADTYRRARGLSDTLYTEAVALNLFAHVLHQFALCVNDAVAITVAESAKERMLSLIGEHDRLGEAHLNDTNVYVAVRSTPS